MSSDSTLSGIWKKIFCLLSGFWARDVLFLFLGLSLSASVLQSKLWGVSLCFCLFSSTVTCSCHAHVACVPSCFEYEATAAAAAAAQRVKANVGGMSTWTCYLPCTPQLQCLGSRTWARSPLHFPSQTPCVTPPSPVTSHCVTLTAVSLRHVTWHYARAGGNGGHYSRSYPRGWCKLLLVFLQSNDSSLLFSTPVIYHFPCPAPVVSPRQTKRQQRGAKLCRNRCESHAGSFNGYHGNCCSQPFGCYVNCSVGKVYIPTCTEHNKATPLWHRRQQTDGVYVVLQ